MKVYISGKIGEEVVSDATREKFAKAEKMLMALGHDVFNPVTSGLGERAEMEMECLNRQGYKVSWYSQILLLDLKALCLCDAIYMLPDYEDSPGALAELAFARAIGMEQVFQVFDQQLP